MDVITNRARLTAIDDELLIVPVFKGEAFDQGMLHDVNQMTGGVFAGLFERGEFDGSAQQSSLIHNNIGSLPRRVLLCGLGDRKADDALTFQRAAGAAVRTPGARTSKTVALLLRPELGPQGARLLVEGALLGAVDGDLYKSNGEPRRTEKFSLVIDPASGMEFEAEARIGTLMAEATNLARRLGNEPSNVMTPSMLAAQAEQLAAREELSVEILDEAQMKQLGMGALLAVSRGSDEPARFIALGYETEQTQLASEQAPIALVGKGITFDSGGISIKNAEKMDEMKYDMGGGAAVIGAMQVIGRLKPTVRVLGLVPASENLPSGRAVKPGDVVRSLSGKTIEVVNTDAEGRLILADAIGYAINKGATTIVDIATLTGACVVALGEVRAGIMGSDQSLVSELIAAGDQSGERLWQLPVDSEYADLIRSDIADIKNVGNRTAGAISAAMFLRSFAGAVKWAHLDIAGTAWLESQKEYMAKGATGFGVRLLSNFILNRASRT